ncbi:MAG TPA: hypothetical protein DE042_09670 [Colwellia sp.]|nr:hypothetical protein [Colwellia sp.]
MILSAFWLKEAVSKQQWLGVFISLSGVLILITKGNLSSLLQFTITQGDILLNFRQKKPVVKLPVD